MVVTISGTAEARLRALSEAAYPNEGCGVLVGSLGGDTAAVDDVTDGRNLVMDRSRDRYLLDPADIIAAERAARAKGQDIVGFWHTHPDHPAWPSQFDADHAWTDYVYVICRVADGVCELMNAFTLPGEGREFDQAELVSTATSQAQI